MRSFCICGFDDIPGGADSLFDLLFTPGQRIVRNIERALRKLDFDHAVYSRDCIGYYLLAGGISELVDFNASGHCFAQTRMGMIRFFVHVF